MTTRKVRDKIMALKPDSAPGPDGLTGHLLQGLADKISPVLALIFSKSLEEGELLADWRSANMTPIFRKGAKSENSRPVVSLTTQYRVQNHGVHCEILNYGPPRGEQPDEPQSLYMQPTRTSKTSISGLLRTAQYLEFNVCTHLKLLEFYFLTLSPTHLLHS